MLLGRSGILPTVKRRRDVYKRQVLGSAQTAVEKPHPRAFALALETLGNPAAAVMIGDNPIADGQGALQAGLQPLLVHSSDKSALFWHCGQLCEIPALLASHSFSTER